MIKECFIAELKMYEKGRGVELSNPLSYDVIYRDSEGNYRNLFNDEESFTTLDRVVGSSNYYYTDRGEEIPFGTKVRLISEKEETGPCWILTGTSMNNIKRDDLENLIINSDDYYKDRINIIETKYSRVHAFSIKERSIIHRDMMKFDKLNAFFEERGIDEFNDFLYSRKNSKKF